MPLKTKKNPGYMTLTNTHLNTHKHINIHKQTHNTHTFEIIVIEYSRYNKPLTEQIIEDTFTDPRQTNTRQDKPSI